MSDALRRTASAFADLRREPVSLALAAACGATECHLVGGALRDRALGLVTHDLDAVVAGRGHEIAAELAAALPARLVALGGKNFAAYRLIVSAAGSTAGGIDTLDLWDRESASLHDDLARRDFSINSFAVELRGGGVADPFGGLEDLERHILRATTPRSFAGDPLRVLRLARLLLRLPGFSVEPETFELARNAAPRVPEVAAERIREELLLVLGHPEAERGLRAFAALGIYPGLWLGSAGPGRPAARYSGAAAAGADAATANDEDAADTDADATRLAAAEIAALPGCAAELESWLATAAPSRDAAAAAGSAASVTGRHPAIDLAAARFAATFRHLAPAAAEAATPSAGGPTEHLARMRQAGYLSARQAAAIAPLLEEPAVLPATELGRRRFLHRHARLWPTAACSFGGAAAVAGATALDRWRLAARPLCELARREGPDLIAPPRLLSGEDVQRLLAMAPGPRVGRALAALTAAQVDGAVRSRDEAERFLREWSSAHTG